MEPKYPPLGRVCHPQGDQAELAFAQGPLGLVCRAVTNPRLPTRLRNVDHTAAEEWSLMGRQLPFRFAGPARQILPFS